MHAHHTMHSAYHAPEQQADKPHCRKPHRTNSSRAGSALPFCQKAPGSLAKHMHVFRQTHAGHMGFQTNDSCQICSGTKAKPASAPGKTSLSGQQTAHDRRAVKRTTAQSDAHVQQRNTIAGVHAAAAAATVTATSCNKRRPSLPQ